MKKKQIYIFQIYHTLLSHPPMEGRKKEEDIFLVGHNKEC